MRLHKTALTAGATRARPALRASSSSGTRSVERDDGARGRMTAGSGARVHRFDRRNVERAMAGRQQPAAEIGILPVEKNPSSKPPTCSNADRRIITQAPDTQSTSTGSDARDQSRLRFESQLSGAILVRKLMRPPRPVVTSGNRRADGCTLPSAFRMRGPTTATSGCRSSQRARVSISPAGRSCPDSAGGDIGPSLRARRGSRPRRSRRSAVFDERDVRGL